MKFMVSGCNGKMGKILCKNIKSNPEYKIVAGIDRNNTCTEKDFDFPIFSKFQEVNSDIKADVVIDFSHSSMLPSILSYCKNTKTPVVLCTTGYSDAQYNEILSCSEFIPIFNSSNMSICVNLLVELSKKAFEILGLDYDVEILEKHHNQKVDAPSGTALMLAKAISETASEKYNTQFDYTYDRHLKDVPRSKHEIGIQSIRGGNIVGDHEIFFMGENEILSISHRAQSRDIFAIGAIKAACFLCNQEKGYYNMKNFVHTILK